MRLLRFNTDLVSTHALFPAVVICNRPLKFEAGTNAQMQLPVFFYVYVYKADRNDLLRRKREKVIKHHKAVSDACGKMGGRLKSSPCVCRVLCLEHPTLPSSLWDLSQWIPFY